MNDKDVVYQIFKYLEIKDIITCSTINKLMNQVCDSQYMRLFNDYGNISAKFFINLSFKQMYITCYELDTFRKRYVYHVDLINFFSVNKLDLNNKNVAKLPESIGQLSNLQCLSLYHNQIVELPESIGQLVNCIIKQ